MYSGPQQPKELLTPSGKPETIQTLEYGYILASTNPKDPVLIVGRDGRDSREAVPVGMVPGLREFVTPIFEAILADPPNAKLIHFQPHVEDAPEMKVSAEFETRDPKGHYWIRIISLPLDFPLDLEGQRNYDTTTFEASAEARFAIRH